MSSNSNNIETSPQVYARTGGVLYLVLILVGMFSVLFVRDKLVVSGDPVTTAHNIMSSLLLWRIGVVADLVMHILDVPVMLIIYVLLRPVNKNIALLAMLFNLVQTSVLVDNKLNLITALFPLSNSDYLKVFEPDQLYTQAYLSIRLHDTGFGVGLIFFGFVCLVNGYLVFRSGYLPKAIGVLLQIAGLCYLINSFTLLIAPQLANSLFPFIMIPCFVAELSFALRLLIKGVNLSRWNIPENR